MSSERYGFSRLVPGSKVRLRYNNSPWKKPENSAFPRSQLWSWDDAVHRQAENEMTAMLSSTQSNATGNSSGLRKTEIATVAACNIRSQKTTSTRISPSMPQSSSQSNTSRVVATNGKIVRDFKLRSIRTLDKTGIQQPTRPCQQERKPLSGPLQRRIQQESRMQIQDHPSEDAVVNDNVSSCKETTVRNNAKELETESNLKVMTMGNNNNDANGLATRSQSDLSTTDGKSVKDAECKSKQISLEIPLPELYQFQGYEDRKTWKPEWQTSDPYDILMAEYALRESRPLSPKAAYLKKCHELGLLPESFVMHDLELMVKHGIEVETAHKLYLSKRASNHVGSKLHHGSITRQSSVRKSMSASNESSTEKSNLPRHQEYVNDYMLNENTEWRSMHSEDHGFDDLGFNEDLCRDRSYGWTIALNHWGIGDQYAKAIAASIWADAGFAGYDECPPQLERLNLRACRLTNTGMLALAKSLCKHPRIKVLDLGMNKFRLRSIVALKPLFRAERTLTWLNLEHNNLGDHAVVAMCQQLKYSKVLGYLNLNGNGIRENGCIALSELFSQVTSLRTVYLSWNHIQGSAASTLLEGLSNLHSKVRYLNLDWNGSFDIQTIEKLCDMFRCNMQLLAISLASNNLSHDACSKLVEAAQKSQSLLSLNLTGNKVPVFQVTSEVEEYAPILESGSVMNVSVPWFLTRHSNDIFPEIDNAIESYQETELQQQGTNVCETPYQKKDPEHNMHPLRSHMCCPGRYKRLRDNKLWRLRQRCWVVENWQPVTFMYFPNFSGPCGGIIEVEVRLQDGTTISTPLQPIPDFQYTDFHLRELHARSIEQQQERELLETRAIQQEHDSEIAFLMLNSIEFESSSDESSQDGLSQRQEDCGGSQTNVIEKFNNDNEKQNVLQTSPNWGSSSSCASSRSGRPRNDPNDNRRESCSDNSSHMDESVKSEAADASLQDQVSSVANCTEIAMFAKDVFDRNPELHEVQQVNLETKYLKHQQALRNENISNQIGDGSLSTRDLRRRRTESKLREEADQERDETSTTKSKFNINGKVSPLEATILLPPGRSTFTFTIDGVSGFFAVDSPVAHWYAEDKVGRVKYDDATIVNYVDIPHHDTSIPLGTLLEEAIVDTTKSRVKETRKGNEHVTLGDVTAHSLEPAEAKLNVTERCWTEVECAVDSLQLPRWADEKLKFSSFWNLILELGSWVHWNTSVEFRVAVRELFWSNWGLLQQLYRKSLSRSGHFLAMDSLTFKAMFPNSVNDALLQDVLDGLTFTAHGTQIASCHDFSLDSSSELANVEMFQNEVQVENSSVNSNEVQSSMEDNCASSTTYLNFQDGISTTQPGESKDTNLEDCDTLTKDPIQDPVSFVSELRDEPQSQEELEQESTLLLEQIMASKCGSSVLHIHLLDGLIGVGLLQWSKTNTACDRTDSDKDIQQLQHVSSALHLAFNHMGIHSSYSSFRFKCTNLLRHDVNVVLKKHNTSLLSWFRNIAVRSEKEYCHSSAASTNAEDSEGESVFEDEKIKAGNKQPKERQLLSYSIWAKTMESLGIVFGLDKLRMVYLSSVADLASMLLPFQTEHLPRDLGLNFNEFQESLVRIADLRMLADAAVDAMQCNALRNGDSKSLPVHLEELIIQAVS